VRKPRVEFEPADAQRSSRAQGRTELLTARMNFVNCHPEPSAGEAEDERGICSLAASKRTVDSSSHSLLGMTIFLFVCFFALPAGVYSEESTCSPSQAQHADAAIDQLHSWEALYKWYGTYRQCDDGGIAQGISEVVARNLVDRWETLPRLAQLGKQSPEFRHFVLKHVDETLDNKDLKIIRTSAATKCPSGLRALCDNLIKQAGHARS
jgi:hypothetical protein